MDVGAHTIRRVEFACRQTGMTLGSGAQERASALWHERLLPGLAEVLDACAPPSEHLVIDRLEVDLDAVDPHWGEDSAARWRRKLREAIAEKYFGSSGERISFAADGDNGALGNEGHGKRTGAPSAERLWSALLAFLRDGRFAWNSPVRTMSAWAEAFRRLAGETTRAGSPDLARALNSATAAGGVACLALLRGSRTARRRAVDSLDRDGLGLLAATLPVRATSANPLPEARGEREAWLSRALAEVGAERPLRKSGEPPAGVRTPRVERPDSRNGAESDTPSRATDTTPDADLTEGIPVSGAGIALLHPYLKRYLCALGLAEGDDLRRPAEAVRALDVLVYGGDHCPEERLVFAKVLCGLSPDAYVGPQLAEPERVHAEADGLLTAVIAHWAALGSTSAEGLRESFLQRDGILRRRGGDWGLVVEQRAYDLLLERLPWPLGVAKLPWVDGVLYVDWA